MINSPELTMLSIAGTSPRATYGHFLPDVLSLRHLQTLELKGCMLDLQWDDSKGEAQQTCVSCASAICDWFCTAVAWLALIALSTNNASVLSK